MQRTYTIECQTEQMGSVEIGSWQNVAEKYTAFMRTIAIVDTAVADRDDLPEIFPEMITIEGGEEAKNIELATELWKMLCEMEVDRQCVLVGIGGGTLTDLVGFVAATYMRGIRCVLIPTTLLGQVDAAIGGKCAINMGGYKNMVGAFALPSTVVCDPSWLTTLPEREWRAGMAEVIKTAIIGDEELFELLEQKNLDEVRQDAALVEEIVTRCVAVKCGIVERDLRDSGERRLLNLGHTFAHAIESLSSDYSHGEAVAVGLTLAACKAVEMGVLDEGVAARIVALVERYNLPTSVDIPTDDLLPAILHDKKMQSGAIHWILPTKIGACIVKKEELA